MMPALAFSTNGTILLRSYDSAVTAWNMKEGVLLYECPGVLIGTVPHKRMLHKKPKPPRYLKYTVKRLKKEAFLTEEGYWDIHTGKKLAPPPELNRDPQYHVRFIKTPTTTSKSPTGDVITCYSYTLEIVDELGTRPVHRIHLSNITDYAGGMALDSWTIDPYRQYIAVSLWMDIMGQELDLGKCYDLDTGEEICDFRPGKIHFSRVHNLMIVDSLKGRVTVFHLLTRQKTEVKYTSRVHKSSIQVNPKYPELVAAISNSGDKIHLMDTSSLQETRSMKASSPPKPKIYRVGTDSLPETHLEGTSSPQKKSPMFVGPPEYQREIIHEVIVTLLDGLYICGIAFHPKGDHIADILSNGEVRIRDIKTRELVMTIKS
ncbi:MAG: hypothetical protein GY833_06660 [Aestuariibacter sp.]|nr:hypothetical protein [Aestuariibacter sp.]